MLVTITEILGLRRIILFISIILFYIKLENFYQEINGISFMELLLNRDSHINISIFTTLSRNIEVLISKESIMRIIDAMGNRVMPITFVTKFIR
jgi:hypothetical protein